MPRFFSEYPPNGEIITITGDDARHIGRSLRMAVGEKITVCHNGTDYLCQLEKISDADAVARVISREKSKEPNINLTLYQALPKLDKLELIVQKAVELGAVRVVPVLTKRCISRPDAGQFEKKLARLNKISLEAAKQSGRGIIPEVSGIIGFEECLEQMRSCDYSVICYEKGGQRLKEQDLEQKKNIGLLVGPEGGFEPYEVQMTENSGAVKVFLGDRILRCETAPLAAIAIIMHLTNNI